MPGDSRLKRGWFARGAAAIARDLLGRHLVRRLNDGTRLSGMIVETEAYLGVRDRASHAFGGRRTDRNEAMYAPGGTAYVYFTYGMHHCFNVVCGDADEPVAVLIRALEPIEGHDVMRRHRGGRPWRDRDLCSGPGKLCRAMSIDRGLNGVTFWNDPRLWIESGEPVGSGRVVRAKRVGVESAGDWASRPLRWCVRECEHVSVKPPRGSGNARAARGFTRGA